MDTLTNQNTSKSNQANDKGKYGELTDVPGKKVDREQLNQSLVP